MDPDRLRDAAVAAEYATGRREETLQEAKRHVVVRLARMVFGFFVLLAGLLMLVLPGPGILAIVAGLVILSEDVAWADRTLRYVKRRVPGVPEDGKVPRSTLIVAAVLAVAGILGAWLVLG